MNANLIFQDRMGSYIHMERYVNNGSPSGWHKRTTSPETNPFTGAGAFALLEFDDSDIETVLLGDCPIFHKGVNYAHPDSFNSSILRSSVRKLNASSIIVSPTSGARTMFIRNGEYADRGYLKLTYDVSRIGRVDRHLSKKHCLACLEASTALKEAVDLHLITSGFGLQLEPAAKISMLPLKNGVYDWGVVYREFAPYPYSDKRVTLVPGFSLFGTDRKAPTDRCLIVQCILNSGRDPTKYLRELLTLILDCYWQVVLACGFHMECHSQNCLFELDEDFNISRLIVRDMDSIDRDIPLQKFLNVKSTWDSYPVMCFDEDIYFYKIRPSYMYDFKLGEYTLSPLIDTVCTEFQLEVEYFEDFVKQYVNGKYIHRLPNEYFPKDHCWYSCDNSERKAGARREYFSHENPKYR